MNPLTALILFVSFVFATCGGHNYEEVIQSLEASLSDALIALGKTAQSPHPQLGIEKPFEPLPAVAPLRYTNEGDLLKLRLLLNNVTLKGLSSLAVQEVSFTIPNKRQHSEEAIRSKGKTHSEESPKLETVVDENEYQDSEEEFPQRNQQQQQEEEESNPLEDMYDYYYYEPNSNNPEKYETIDSDKIDYEYDEEDIYDPTDSDSLSSSGPRELDEDKLSHRYKRSGDAARKDHSRHTKGRHSRKPKSKRHHSEKHESTKRISNASDSFHREFSDKILNYETLFKHSRHHTRHSHQQPHQHQKSKMEESRSPSSNLRTAKINRRSTAKPLLLKSSVRISFSDIQISAQYVVKGSAGGVFTFKEQGNLILTIPNVFLTSTFNVTLTPDFSGLRHWKNGRNHVRVQKVRSRMSIETPQLKLIPASRPPEWVRRQVQQKMEELGDGVGRRDGAIRLLLRHWARLLRKLVTRAAKDSTSDY